jgi:hypothetical protein
VEAKRNADIGVTIKKDGYEPQIVPLTKELPGSGAAGFGRQHSRRRLIGIGVDAITGSARDDKPNPVSVTLRYSATARASSIAPSNAASAKTAAARESSSRIFPSFVT